MLKNNWIPRFIFCGRVKIAFNIFASVQSNPQWKHPYLLKTIYKEVECEWILKMKKEWKIKQQPLFQCFSERGFSQFNTYKAQDEGVLNILFNFVVNSHNSKH